MTKQKHKIVLVDTNKSRIAFEGNEKHELYCNNFFQRSSKVWNPQHLYILSNEKIKEGEMKYCSFTNKITKYDRMGIIPGTGLCEDCSKIIATTNPDLHKDGIAKISDADIQWMIGKFNRKEDLREVELECEEVYDGKSIVIDYNCMIIKPKLTKDGCVIICKEENYIQEVTNALHDGKLKLKLKEHDCIKYAKINCKCPEGVCNYKKDGFTREEVKQAIIDWHDYCSDNENNSNALTLNEWFNQHKF